MALDDTTFTEFSKLLISADEKAKIKKTFADDLSVYTRLTNEKPTTLEDAATLYLSASGFGGSNPNQKAIYSSFIKDAFERKGHQYAEITDALESGDIDAAKVTSILKDVFSDQIYNQNRTSHITAVRDAKDKLTGAYFEKTKISEDEYLKLILYMAERIVIKYNK